MTIESLIEGWEHCFNGGNDLQYIRKEYLEIIKLEHRRRVAAEEYIYSFNSNYDEQIKKYKEWKSIVEVLL